MLPRIHLKNYNINTQILKWIVKKKENEMSLHTPTKNNILDN